MRGVVAIAESRTGTTPATCWQSSCVQLRSMFLAPHHLPPKCMAMSYSRSNRALWTSSMHGDVCVGHAPVLACAWQVCMYTAVIQLKQQRIAMCCCNSWYCSALSGCRMVVFVCKCLDQKTWLCLHANTTLRPWLFIKRAAERFPVSMWCLARCIVAVRDLALAGNAECRNCMPCCAANWSLEPQLCTIFVNRTFVLVKAELIAADALAAGTFRAIADTPRNCCTNDGWQGIPNSTCCREPMKILWAVERRYLDS